MKINNNQIDVLLLNQNESEITKWTCNLHGLSQFCILKYNKFYLCHKCTDSIAARVETVMQSPLVSFTKITTGIALCICKLQTRDQWHRPDVYTGVQSITFAGWFFFNICLSESMLYGMASFDYNWLKINWFKTPRRWSDVKVMLLRNILNRADQLVTEIVWNNKQIMINNHNYTNPIIDTWHQKSMNYFINDMSPLDNLGERLPITILNASISMKIRLSLLLKVQLTASQHWFMTRESNLDSFVLIKYLFICKGSAPNRRHAITWTNADPVQRRTCVVRWEGKMN